MNYSEYMKMECVVEKYLGENENTSESKYDTPKTIKCFKHGKRLYVRDEFSSAIVSAQSYIVEEELTEKDIIDGQVIKSIDLIPDFDGGVPIRECLTW